MTWLYNPLISLHVWVCTDLWGRQERSFSFILKFQFYKVKKSTWVHEINKAQTHFIKQFVLDYLYVLIHSVCIRCPAWLCQNAHFTAALPCRAVHKERGAPRVKDAGRVLCVR